MRIVKIGQFGAKLRAFENREKSQIHGIQSFLVISRVFQMHVTLYRIDGFERFSSQIQGLFFYFNHFFAEYLLVPLRDYYWFIINDYISSIFRMLNSHKKWYIVYLGRKVGLFRPNVEFAVRVEGELAQAEGECVLRTEDEYCNHTRSKGPLSPRCTPYFVWLMY